MHLILSLALILFFGWFAADAVMSLLAQPLEGIYYPMASGGLKSMPNDSGCCSCATKGGARARAWPH